MHALLTYFQVIQKTPCMPLDPMVHIRCGVWFPWICLSHPYSTNSTWDEQHIHCWWKMLRALSRTSSMFPIHIECFRKLPLEVYSFQSFHKGKLPLRQFIEGTIDFKILNFKRQEWPGMREDLHGKVWGKMREWRSQREYGDRAG